jgi:hypothetical protein
MPDPPPQGSWARNQALRKRAGHGLPGRGSGPRQLCQGQVRAATVFWCLQLQPWAQSADDKAWYPA